MIDTHCFTSRFGADLHGGTTTFASGPHQRGAQISVAMSAWHVTPMLRDAEAGCFGAPVTFPIKLLKAAPYTSCMLDRTKVERFKLDLNILTKPSLICQDGNGNIRTVFDGHHRLAALQETGWPHFRAWSIPPAAAEIYQVSAQRIAAATALMSSKLEELHT